MDIASAIDKLISEHGSAAILRDHLGLLRDQAKLLEYENAQQKMRIVELEDVVRMLTSQIKARTKEEEFVEHHGALFKRRPDGSFHRAVYCPICKAPTGCLIPDMPYGCRQSCGWISSFTGRELDGLLNELTANRRILNEHT